MSETDILKKRTIHKIEESEVKEILIKYLQDKGLEVPEGDRFIWYPSENERACSQGEMFFSVGVDEQFEVLTKRKLETEEAQDGE